MNHWDSVRAAIDAGKQAQQAVNDNAGVMASLLAGNLRRGIISPYVLKRLKDELRGYNAHTRQWKA